MIIILNKYTYNTFIIKKGIENNLKSFQTDINSMFFNFFSFSFLIRNHFIVGTYIRKMNIHKKRQTSEICIH